MRYPQLPIFSLLAAVLVLIPLPWHWRARNVATLALIFWLSVVNLIYGVNSLIWAGNVDYRIPVWCDITTKVVVGASYALPLSTLCICKHLEMVSSSRKVSYDSRDRRRRMIFEIVLCFLVPILFMALHYIVQGHRFDIFEDFGCQAAMYISIQAVFIIWFPQLLFSVITFLYASLALYNFLRRRLTFAAHLQNSNSALTTNRYMRLIAMSLAQMVCGTSLTSYNLYNNVKVGLRPWTSWADVHSDWNRADQWLLDELPPAFVNSMFLLWWAMPISAYIFFVFFGFGEEAKKEYKRFYAWFRKAVLRRPADDKKGLPMCSFPSSCSPKLLHLVNLKSSNGLASGTSSPSDAFHSKSANSVSSHISQSTITLAPSPGSAFEFKKPKSDEISEAAPDYYASYPWTTPQPRTLIGQPIRPWDTPAAKESPLPDLPADAHANPDDSFATASSIADETFTISTFSYYENVGSMSMGMGMGMPPRSRTPVSPTSTCVPEEFIVRELLPLGRPLSLSLSHHIASILWLCL
ncbi:hypothetical protein D9619_009306 [Psilocybe cf. subviscida]|uniref:STE3-domain-containing protein n=1 Tax=Psilocybe cf. subviscida TaxID=2480587 RepID=A0A8H5BUM1_9AGAR|nr:hypothetical protein D9619_009306 [Psilocybe cf. subviscida]